MLKTYETLRELSNLYEGKYDLDAIALEYQQTGDPILFAKAYCKWFPFAVSQANNYWGLTDQDKASISVEELHKCMMAFKPERGGKVQTLFAKYLNNRLRAESQMSNHHVRKANNVSECYETQTEAGNMERGYEDAEFNSTIDNCHLTSNENEYCKMVGAYPNIKDVDIAKKLGVSSAAINYMKKQLCFKLNFMLA